MKQAGLLFAALLAASAQSAELGTITRGGFTVQLTECPKCEMRGRFSPDGKMAFMNVSRLKDDNPDADTLAARQKAQAERSFKLMASAADARKTGSRTRPLMGWSSWNTFGLGISESIILDVAKAMATNGLRDAGYVYVNIDDGFFAGHDEKGNLKWNVDRFPNGMKPVVDGIHALGLKAGTYSDAGINTCGSMWGNDKKGLGSGLFGHDAADCKLHFNDLGFDFIKVDYCGAQAQKLDERKRYTEISEAIKATGRTDVRFNMCRWAYPGTWSADVADSWRTTGDIRANWKSIKSIIGENLYLSAYATPGHYNDLDMLEVGQLAGLFKTAFGKEDAGLTPVEETTHFGMWCILSSPLLIGCDVRTIPPSSRELLTNSYLLSMNQNDLGLHARIALREGEAYVLVKDADELYGKSRFAALYNASEEDHEFRVPFAALELDGKVAAFDLVERADMGDCEKEFVLTVPPHGSRFLRLDAERRLERTLYEAEAAFLTEYQELRDPRKAGTAFYDPMNGASGGMVVRNLGNGLTNDLVWKDVKTDVAGKCRLEFDYNSPGSRNFYVKIDGGTKNKFKVKKTVGTLDTASLEVELSAGVHEVRIFNDGDWTPDIDCMRLVR